MYPTARSYFSKDRNPRCSNLADDFASEAIHTDYYQTDMPQKLTQLSNCQYRTYNHNHDMNRLHLSLLIVTWSSSSALLPLQWPRLEFSPSHVPSCATTLQCSWEIQVFCEFIRLFPVGYFPPSAIILFSVFFQYRLCYTT